MIFCTVVENTISVETARCSINNNSMQFQDYHFNSTNIFFIWEIIRLAFCWQISFSAFVVRYVQPVSLSTLAVVTDSSCVGTELCVSTNILLLKHGNEARDRWWFAPVGAQCSISAYHLVYLWLLKPIRTSLRRKSTSFNYKRGLILGHHGTIARNSGSFYCIPIFGFQFSTSPAVVVRTWQMSSHIN